MKSNWGNEKSTQKFGPETSRECSDFDFKGGREC